MIIVKVSELVYMLAKLVDVIQLVLVTVKPKKRLYC